MDKRKIEEGVRLLIEGIGEDLEREGLRETPKRVADMFEEIFAGITMDPTEIISVTFAESHDEMVLVKDIPLYSICEHHFLPFVGKAHVAYIPGPSGKITGLSKLARAVDAAAKRPQLQERLTTTIADSLVSALDPHGVFVMVEAEHMCMSMRGVQKPGHLTVTSAVRGIFRTNEASRVEVLSFIRGR